MTNEKNNLPPLHKASWIGTVENVEQLIIGGADIKERDSDGNTALHWAATGIKAAHAQVLIDAGVDVFARNNDKQTALLLAIESHGYGNDLAQCLCEAMEKKGGEYWEITKKELEELDKKLRLAH